MILKTIPARHAIAALGSCALFLAPALANAQAAETKASEVKQADAPADTTAYTLRLKFKAGDVNKYKSATKMSITAPSGASGETKTSLVSVSALSEQKTTKLLDGGGAEIVTTTTSLKSETDGKASDAPEVPVVTMQLDPLGKVLSTKAASDNATDAMKSLFSNNLSSPQSFLPNAAVKVGDKWTQKISLPGPFAGQEGAMDCSFVRVETIGGVKTALIHTIMKMPLAMMVDMTGQLTKIEGDAMALFNGTVIANSDISFAIDEGKVIRTLSDSNTDIAIKLGKAAPPEAASFLPDGTKMAVRTNVDMKILAPGEKVELPKPVAPEKK